MLYIHKHPVNIAEKSSFGLACFFMSKHRASMRTKKGRLLVSHGGAYTWKKVRGGLPGMFAFFGEIGSDGFRYFRGSEEACRLWLSYRLECCRQDGQDPPAKVGVMSDTQAAKVRFRGRPVFVEREDRSPVCRWCFGDQWVGHRLDCPNKPTR